MADFPPVALKFQRRTQRQRFRNLGTTDKKSSYKIKHTGATLAKQAGVSLEAFSEALTHSDKEITKTYVNIKDKVNQTVGDIAFRSLKN